MANTIGLIHASIWDDPEFVSRSAAAQRLYLLLFSQKDIDLCGVLPLRPNRWAHLATDTKPAAITKALRELEQHRFVITDAKSDEALVRTFVRWAGTLKQPNVIVGMSKHYGLIRSPKLRQAVIEALPASALDIVHGTARTNLAEPFLGDFLQAKGIPSWNPSPKGSAKGSRNGSANDDEKGSETPSSTGSLNRCTAEPLDRGTSDEVDPEGRSQVLPLRGSAPRLRSDEPQPLSASLRSLIGGTA